MRIDLFNNGALARDTLRLREQIASRSGSVKNVPAYKAFINSLSKEQKESNLALMKEFEFLQREKFRTTDRYYRIGGITCDKLLQTELLGFFDDEATPKHTTILDLTGICPTALSLLTRCDISALQFESSHIKHMRDLELFNWNSLKVLREFPLIGLDPFIDMYVLERYQDLCLDTGTSGELSMREAKYIMNCELIKMMVSIGTYTSQMITKSFNGGKAFLRTFNPNIYIIKSEDKLVSSVDLYFRGAYLFTAPLNNMDYYVRNTAILGGHNNGLGRESKAS